MNSPLFFKSDFHHLNFYTVAFYCYNSFDFIISILERKIF